MVMCGAMIYEEDLKKLIALKPRDSKLMTAAEREHLYSKLLPVLKHCKVFVLQPNEIDKAVHGHDGLNLNKLEARKSAEILNNFNHEKAIIDCPSNNIHSYKIYLKKLVKNKKIELILEHNAERYPLVAAASIIAKVTGDREVEKSKSALISALAICQTQRQWSS